MKHLIALGAVIAAAISFSAGARAAEFVTNGSLENGTFSPGLGDCCNYMALGNGSTVITGWTVVTSSGSIVWALSPTGDGHNAADDKYFVDLSGYGSNAQNAAIQQTLSTTPGQTYTLSFDAETTDVPKVTLGSLTISVSLSGTEGEFNVYSGTFVAPVGSQLLSVNNISNTNQVVFIDDISVTGDINRGVPEASTWAMMLIGFAGLGYMAFRRQTITPFA